jgi:uncharacterized protein
LVPYHRDVPPTLTIAPEVARRFLAIRHFLAPPRSLPAEPTSVMTVVDRIGSLQFDPLEVAGRNHDLVLLSRIAGYRREWTDALLYEERALYETYNKGLSLVPTKELPFYRLTWDRNQVEHKAGIFESHGQLVDELLDRIRTGGPMSASDVEPREAIDWFWRPTNQVRAVLEALAISGVLGLARRDGNRRVYDLAERLFPPDVLADRSRTVREQLRHRLFSRYRAHGLLGRAGQAEIWMGLGRAVPSPEDPDWPVRTELRAELEAEGCIVPVSVEGVRGDRFVVADDLPLLDQARREVGRGEPPGGSAPGVAFLAPLDPLAWDREFLRTCFGFDYIWEVYVPAAKRRWGYYVLPILFGDRLVGRIEPRLERASPDLRILGIWFEKDFSPMEAPDFIAALRDALEAYRSFVGARRVVWPRTRLGRDLAAALDG